MTTYVEQPDPTVTISMVLLIVAILAIIGFGIWYFGGFNTGPTIIHDTTTVPVPQLQPQPILVPQTRIY